MRHRESPKRWAGSVIERRRDGSAIPAVCGQLASPAGSILNPSDRAEILIKPG
jgi:hypothetical protein